MSKVTVEQIQCDICLSLGTRFTVSFPDGVKILDRCSKHDRKLQALREEPGDWTAITRNRGGGRGLRITTLDGIAAQRAQKAE